eukprot:TRINITY_DN11195_c0_g1_i1.p1 TRINITY_DN11195_c0_g1~~TRINITY_DN11195_c0_g1_i1.p1  ORF type:complete len:166 (-),score=43.61 TRINITY_DN11195_c0_g1_i1:114-611(-)
MCIRDRMLTEDLTKILSLLKLCRVAMKLIRLNLFWAFIYNVLAIPIAAGVFKFNLGIEISPMISSLSMTMSSLVIVASSNTIRLINFDYSERASKTISASEIKVSVRKVHVTDDLETGNNSSKDKNSLTDKLLPNGPGPMISNLKSEDNHKDCLLYTSPSPRDQA